MSLHWWPCGHTFDDDIVYPFDCPAHRPLPVTPPCPVAGCQPRPCQHDCDRARIYIADTQGQN